MIFKLQEILISEEFEEIQEKFMDSHCDMFNDGDECGHDQYVAFTEFKKKIESHIEEVEKEISDFFCEGNEGSAAEFQSEEVPGVDQGQGWAAG